MKSELCRAFCDEILVKEVPCGLAVSLAFRRADGDAIGFYVIRNKAEPGLVHLEDDGTTRPYLEACGVDFDTQTRARAFKEILDEYGAHFDEDEAVVRTDDVPEPEIPKMAIGFAALLLRLSDFLLLTQDHAASAFREDAIKRIREALADRAFVEEDELVDTMLSEVRPDLVIRAPKRDPVAVFLAESPQRVNDAIFLQMSALYEAHIPVSVVALLKKNSTIAGPLSQRAHNRLAAVPVYEKDEGPSIQRIVREVVGSGAIH
jgi:hypothetical protein